MQMRAVPGAACPLCAGDVMERYADEASAAASYVADRVLGRSCVNSSCRWRQFSQVSPWRLART